MATGKSGRTRINPKLTSRVNRTNPLYQHLMEGQETAKKEVLQNFLTQKLKVKENGAKGNQDPGNLGFQLRQIDEKLKLKKKLTVMERKVNKVQASKVNKHDFALALMNNIRKKKAENSKWRKIVINTKPIKDKRAKCKLVVMNISLGTDAEIFQNFIEDYSGLTIKNMNMQDQATGSTTAKIEFAPPATPKHVISARKTLHGAIIDQRKIVTRTVYE